MFSTDRASAAKNDSVTVMHAAGVFVWDDFSFIPTVSDIEFCVCVKGEMPIPS